MNKQLAVQMVETLKILLWKSFQFKMRVKGNQRSKTSKAVKILPFVRYPACADVGQ